MVICKKCGRSNEDHYRFCLGCGARLADQRAASAPPEVPPIYPASGSMAPASGSAPPGGSMPPGGWAAASSTPGSIPPVSASVAPSPASRPVGVAASSSSGQRMAVAEPAAAPKMTDEAPPPHLMPAAPVRPDSSPPTLPMDAPAPAAVDRACTSCGAAVPEGFVFCGKCGTRYVEPAPPPPPEPPPAPRPLARFVLIQPDGTEGGSLELMEGERVLGRGDGTPLGGDPFLSPQHVRVQVSSAGVTVEDAGSMNGVFIRVLAQSELLDGAEVRIGQELLRFRAFSALDSDLPASSGEARLASPEHAGAWGRLERIIGPELASHAWVLSAPSVALGRDTGDITFREDGFVSGRHARIFHQAGRSFVEDLGSSNGTYIRLRGARKLEAGELILLGQQVVRLALLS